MLLVIWQIAAVRLNQPWIFPKLIETPFPEQDKQGVINILVHPYVDIYASGSLFSNTIISLLRVLIGFTLAAVVGVTLGLIMGALLPIRHLLEPLIELLRPLCPIAWLPFAMVLFKLKTLPNLLGLGYTHTIFDRVQLGMIFVLFVGGFFPILTNTLDGVAGVRRNYLALARMLGAGRYQSFMHVYLSAALPMIFTGLRQGIGLCWFVIIAAEMMTGADSGIGYLLMYAAAQAGMDVVIACMLIIGTIGALLNFIMRWSMQTLVRWHSKEI
ncbi:MAG: hypothetical protein AMJ79_10695 [Phycisphaerae bacterium SM23_30]|nr:MAG: hypothetical protein AMJ79_10695 [Phycisphaerae bacterium SM23_30]